MCMVLMDHIAFGYMYNVGFCNIEDENGCDWTADVSDMCIEALEEIELLQ